ncbi:MAG TPA: ester cyclase [Niabella sp.]|nr:ester cyclase [Niabella sp.]
MKTNKEIISEFIEATNSKNWERVLELTHLDFIRHSSSFPYEIISNAALIDFHKQELETFPDMRENILLIIEEEELVAARIHFSGTQYGKLGDYPPTGKKLDACFNCFFRVVNGLIKETWVEYDNLNGLIQLGHYK